MAAALGAAPPLHTNDTDIPSRRQGVTIPRPPLRPLGVEGRGGVGAGGRRTHALDRDLP